MARVLINLGSGIGDAVLMIPVILNFKKSGYCVDAYFTQKGAYELLKSLDILNSYFYREKITFNDLQSYDLFLSDFLLSFKFAMYAFGGWVKTGANLKCLYSPHKKNKLRFFLFPNIKWVAMLDGPPIRKQNLLLTESTQLDSISDKGMPKIAGHFECGAEVHPYVVLQVSSGDSVDCSKNWSLDKWKQLILRISSEYPELKILVVGGASELSANAFLPSNVCKNLKSLIGQTSMSEIIALIAGSKLYLGLDSGLMHIAANMGIPTVSIWGPSSIADYGYEDGYLGSRHLSISSNLPCSPCLSPYKSNTIRVTSPSKCPDKYCLSNLSAKDVAPQVLNFFKSVIN